MPLTLLTFGWVVVFWRHRKEVLESGHIPIQWLIILVICIALDVLINT